MTLSELTPDQVRSQLASDQGLNIKTGPFSLNIHSTVTSVADNILGMYQDYGLVDDSCFIDFHVAIKKPKNLRCFIKPQVQFYFDGIPPFKPLPFDQAFPMLEWGLNLCVSSTANQFLIIHAAVIEKDGAAIILPGPSGSGKSTLCATLINSGWRLLSDELTLISCENGMVYPLGRPVSLKNQSINIIKNRFPETSFTPVTKDTAKGTVAHMQAPTDSVLNSDNPAPAKFVIFPKYIPSSEAKLTEVSKGQQFMKLIENSFNYSLLGEKGFMVMSQMMRQCRCFDFSYSSLDDAIKVFNNLSDNRPHE
tara:strand:- start:42623 stop:43546 length:924 start_codon:yes stop_codon:yes gene_type:complete